VPSYVKYVQMFVKPVLPNVKNMPSITTIAKIVLSLAKPVLKLVHKKNSEARLALLKPCFF
jgi:hypothetical protein